MMTLRQQITDGMREWLPAYLRLTVWAVAILGVVWGVQLGGPALMEWMHADPRPHPLIVRCQGEVDAIIAYTQSIGHSPSPAEHETLMTHCLHSRLGR
jgi:hypothetical protein